jgi:periplasmic divalent cation tolerance protein
MPTLFVTAPPDAAAELASDVLEERLAACVNRLDCRSTYRWEGEVHDEDEEILLVKTTEERVDECREWLETEHPYEVPCIERFDASETLPSFAEWRADVVK